MFNKNGSIPITSCILLLLLMLLMVMMMMLVMIIVMMYLLRGEDCETNADTDRGS